MTFNATLTRKIISFIKNFDGSYSEIIKEAKRRFDVRLAKSTISYYRSDGKLRIKVLDFDAIEKSEWDWLVGLYYADGYRRKGRNYSYRIEFYLTYQADKNILQKLCSILQRMGLHSQIFIRGNRWIVRTVSRCLFERPPIKRERYHPTSMAAFVSGLIDGDGNIEPRWRGARFSFCAVKHKWLATVVYDYMKHFNPQFRVYRKTSDSGKLSIEHRVEKSGGANFLCHLREDELLTFCVKLQDILRIESWR